MDGSNVHHETRHIAAPYAQFIDGDMLPGHVELPFASFGQSNVIVLGFLQPCWRSAAWWG